MISPHRFHPIIALRRLRQLSADPEDTSKVFEVIRAASGPSLRKGLARFREREEGRRILAREINLLDTLRDRERLRAMPEGSLGRAYYDFTYAEHLSADGLVDASMSEEGAHYDGMSPDMQRYAERLRDQHDIWHTLTQYGRDELGETCLLGFTYAQGRNRGIGLIVLYGVWQLHRAIGMRAVRAIWQGFRSGLHASWLPGEDWERMLELPIEEVRRLLAIRPPTAYWEVGAKAGHSSAAASCPTSNTSSTTSSTTPPPPPRTRGDRLVSP